MKTIIKNAESGVYETAKRIFYSFQVLMVGIAIPVLFAIGISNHEPKRATKDDVSKETSTSQLSSKPIIQLNTARI